MNKRIVLLGFLLIIALAAVIVYWLGFGFNNVLLQQGVFLSAPVIATVAAIFALLKYGVKTSRSITFLFFATGMAYWLIGEVLFDYYNYILHIDPFPSIADIFYLSAYPFFLVGLINEIKTAQVNWKQLDKSALFLFFTIAILLGGLVSYFGIFQTYDSGSPLLTNIIATSYGIGDLSLILVSLFLLILAMEFRGGNMSRVWFVLFINFSLTLIADILFALYTTQYNNHEWFMSSLLDSLWMASYLLFAYGMFEFGFSIQDAYKKIASIKMIALRTHPEAALNKNLDQTKDEFMSFISHELRAPMGAVKGLVSMMLKGDYGPVPDRFKQPLNNVYVSAERQIRMINDILNISRFQQGRIHYTLLDFSLQKVTNQVVEELRSHVKQKRITLSIENGTELMVQGDDIWVKQILDNVVGNAVKFTETGGVTITFRTEGDLAMVVVTDTGVGISPVDQEKLFVKFQQLTESVLHTTIGSGLGLYISREVSRKMGGDVRLEKSELGKGSTFLLALPVAGSQTATDTRSKLEKEKLLSLNGSTAK